MSEPGNAATAPTTAPQRGTPAGWLLAALALAWLGAMLWSAQKPVAGNESAEVTVTAAAYALPGTVSASLVAGAALALALVRAAAAGPTARAVPGSPRAFALATSAGLIVGLVGAGTILATYGAGAAVAALAGTIAAAGVIGGALAGTRATGLVAATAAAALAVFVVAFVLNLFQAPLLEMFGAGASGPSRASALGWFALTASLASGLAAGLVAYQHLRRATRGGPAVRWVSYAVAGAGPGLLLAGSEVLARTAGARVLAMAGSISAADGLAQSLLGGSRVNNALIITFVGAVTAIIAVGRTLRPADAPAASPDRLAHDRLDDDRLDDDRLDGDGLDDDGLEHHGAGPDRAAPGPIEGGWAHRDRPAGRPPGGPAD